MSGTYDDLVARVEALESAGGISLDQLPMADLMRRLETDWKPDSAALLQPGGIITDLLGDGNVTKGKLATDALQTFLQLTAAADIRISLGVQTLTWAAAAALSAVATVTHNLKNADGTNRTPTKVFALVNGTGGPDLVLPQAFTLGATTFQLQGGFRTGTAAGILNIPCAWAAIG